MNTTTELVDPVPVARPSRLRTGSAAVPAPSVPPVISPNAAQPVAANGHDPRKDFQTKVYPTVDRAHTAGDPPAIDHSADFAPVTPTATFVSVDRPK